MAVIQLRQLGYMKLFPLVFWLSVYCIGHAMGGMGVRGRGFEPPS